MAYDGTYITDLDPTLPAPVPLTQPEPTTVWDDAMREIKRCSLNSFPNIDGPVLVTQAQLNMLSLTDIQIIQRDGGAMTGPLIASRDPVEDLELVTKQWVDALFAVPPTVPGPEYEYGYIDIAEIPRQALTLNTLYQVANTLSDTPTKWIVKLHCIEAEYGYEIGDEIKIEGPQSNDTSNNAYRGGLTASANVTDLSIQTGARIYIMDRREAYAGIQREATIYKWELSGKAIQIGELSLLQACTPIGQEAHNLTVTAHGNSTQNLDISFFDRTNDRFLFTAPGGSENVYGCWDLANDVLLWEKTHDDGSNNRAYCFGWSDADNGSTDRYMQCNRHGAAELDIDGNFIRTLNSAINDGIIRNGWECQGWFGYEVSNGCKGFKKGDVTPEGHYWQQVFPAGYTAELNKQYISLPDQTYFFTILINSTSGMLAVCAYTPDDSDPGGQNNGTPGTPVDTIYLAADWKYQGAAYDGAHVFLLLFNDGAGSNHKLLKIDLTGAVIAVLDLSTGSSQADPDVNTNVSVGGNGWVCVTLEDSTTAYFIKATDGTVVTRTTTYNHLNDARYDGVNCTLFVTNCYGTGADGTGEIYYECLQCPAQG